MTVPRLQSEIVQYDMNIQKLTIRRCLFRKICRRRKKIFFFEFFEKKVTKKTKNSKKKLSGRLINIFMKNDNLFNTLMFFLYLIHISCIFNGFSQYSSWYSYNLQQNLKNAKPVFLEVLLSKEFLVQNLLQCYFIFNILLNK